MDAPPNSASRNSQEGRRIDRYQITGELGRGAMGMVYRAEDPLLERQVALKVLSIAMADREGADFRERFFREAKAAGRLNHPNIVTIYDVGEAEDGTPFISMEYLQGRTLRDSLDTGVVPTVRRVADIGTLVARGLAFAHEHGVVHRDIKPGNIMLTRNGMVKIMDFGIARSGQGAQTMIDTVLGSPKYMAPEQITGATVDARADIFSLAVTLYEMLCGRAPFDGDSIPAIMHQVLSVQPPPPSSLNPDVPELLDQVIIRALAKNPDERTGAARELGESLRAISKSLRGQTPAKEIVPPPLQPEAPLSELGDATIAVSPLSPLPVSPPPRQPAASPPPRPVIKPDAGVSKTPPKTSLSGSPAAWMALGGVALLLVAIFSYVTSSGKTSTVAQPEAAEQPTAVDAPSEQEKSVVRDEESTSVLQSQPIIPIIEPLPEPKPVPVADTQPQELLSPDVAEQPANTNVSEATQPPSNPAPIVKTPPPPPKPATGNVQVTAIPWGEIYVDGKRRGISPPLHSVELAPGTHTIEIRNSDLQTYREKVEVKSGETVRIRYQFQ